MMESNPNYIPLFINCVKVTEELFRYINDILIGNEIWWKEDAKKEEVDA